VRQLVSSETLTVGKMGVRVNVVVKLGEGVKVNMGVLVARAPRVASTAFSSSARAVSVEATIRATWV
jgi:hypothetical protein